ncbi:hypothetical protein AVDCRST_MAG94-3279 [uncultured Leptolyngbya sp.]|uniref:Uncharacterized protein n=1 Tax=uncultured Leptolyngbya sp. TaxID=332963 RepID=A0A6J4MMU2_9CYAN|nr:hypothetical protein AVDCRST_MAG94-3279 [uncultured Leptolyngbya sp.]
MINHQSSTAQLYIEALKRLLGSNPDEQRK